MPFDNPYTFIPPMDPPQGASYDPAKPAENMLHQGPPAGHDRYHDGLWSGRIGIEIETVTPLLVPEAKPVPRPANATYPADHKVFATRHSADGKPLLPVTSFKGPLRAAYEAVTNSRFGVFRGQHAPLARRMKAEEGLLVVPARVVEANGGKAVELWLGTRVSLPHESPLPAEGAPPVLYAAWLPMWRTGYIRSFSANFKHGDEVDCRLQRVEHTGWKSKERLHNRDIDFWEVTAIRTIGVPSPLDRVAAAGELNPTLLPGQSKYSPTADTIQARGFVVATGRNFGRKHDERIFFLPADGYVSPTPQVIPVSNVEFKTLEDRWTKLVDNSRALHAESIRKRRANGQTPQQFFSGAPGKTAFSRHTYDESDRRLIAGQQFSWDNDDAHKIGTLCYASVKAKGTVLTVDALYPVMIGRELGLASPYEMLNERLRPATRFEDLSPADRVFGWVRDETANALDGNEAKSKVGQGVWKGQLRVSTIECTGCSAMGSGGKPLAPIERFTQPLPLTILSTPKPAQARFYAAVDKKGTPLSGDVKAKAYFDPARASSRSGLRGRKVYPHHAQVASNANYWNATSASAEGNRNNHYETVTAGASSVYREYVRHRGTKPNNDPIKNQDDQNRSMQDWIRPKTMFKTYIDIVNFNAAELGALLWLLDLARSEPGNPEAHLRIGGGKPLGFGSVKVKITSLDLSVGSVKAEHYKTLAPRDAEVPTDPARSLICRDPKAADIALHAEQGPVAAFRKTVKQTYNGRDFANVPFIAAFLAAARGNANLPVHYPRREPLPDPAGENFKWFQSNDNDRVGLGRPKALPAATDSTGLLYEAEAEAERRREAERANRGGGGRRR